MTHQPRLGPGREFDLIRTFRPLLPDHPELVVGAGDDAAVLQGGWVMTIDASVEDVHFRRDWLSAEEIGYRAATVAISDLAAMAAAPVALLVSLVLRAQDYEQAASIMMGVASAASTHGAAVAGGDTARTAGPLMIDVAALGRAQRPVLRSGARPGDEIWMTGVLGGAAAAVQAWQAQQPVPPAARLAYARPAARTREALWLQEQVELHALIDVSDGLASEAAHLAAASAVQLHLETERIPIHEAALDTADPLRLALTGGDDYELCFTAAPGAVESVRSAFETAFNLPLRRIGLVAAGSGVEWVSADGSRLSGDWKGYDHFGVSA